MVNISIINNTGFLVSPLELMEDNKLLTYELEENEKIVPKLNDFSLIKPRWNGTEWVESATKEEIQAYQEENTTTEKEPSEQEKLNAQLLEEIAQQKIVNTQLMQEIASLKGGNTNV